MGRNSLTGADLASCPARRKDERGTLISLRPLISEQLRGDLLVHFKATDWMHEIAWFGVMFNRTEDHAVPVIGTVVNG